MEGYKSVDHCGHCDDGEESGGDTANRVAEIEETDGETAENDSEVKPGEEGTFVCEEDFGLDAGGERDALACEEGRRLVDMRSDKDSCRARSCNVRNPVTVGRENSPGAVWRSG